jgi:hypothetical protein
MEVRVTGLEDWFQWGRMEKSGETGVNRWVTSPRRMGETRQNGPITIKPAWEIDVDAGQTA